jgi:hypothetical protein
VSEGVGAVGWARRRDSNGTTLIYRRILKAQGTEGHLYVRPYVI